MEWQFIIALNVMMISFIALIVGLINRHQTDPWMLTMHAGIVAAGALALYLGLDHAGTLLAGLFVFFVAAPGLLLLRANRAYLQARYGEAVNCATWAARLHPSPLMTFNAAMLKAMATEDIDQNLARLQQLRSRADACQATQIDTTVARLHGDWGEVLRILYDPASDARGVPEVEIRALGELGRTDELVEAYERNKARMSPHSLHLAQIFLLAFCGRPDGIALLRSSKKSVMHSDYLSYWEAVAAFNARGRRGEGRALLETVANARVLPAVRASARRYLDTAGTCEPVCPSPASAAVAESIVQRWHEAGTMSAARLIHAPVTLTLLAANAVMFGLEHWYGGVEDAKALVTLGALWPPLVSEQNEWWRLLSALFLHYGWAHFTMNMASLLVLGRMVETAFGSRRMLLIYSLGGLGSMAMVFTSMAMGWSAADFVVGASGAIMALFGAWAARLILRWWRSGDILDRQPALLIAVVLAVQVGVDLSVPQISFTGHLSGFIIGFVVAMLLGAVQTDQRRVLPART